MNQRSIIIALSSWPIVLASLFPSMVLAANAANPQPDKRPPAAVSRKEQQSDEELDEILVEGHKRTRNPQQVMNWLSRLVGKYTYDGYVDLHGGGKPEDQQPVQGFADCVALGSAPGVRCEMKVSWPEARDSGGGEILGGVSTLNPAMLVLGYEPNLFGIRYMQVDSRGVADGALGSLFGDTLISRAPCVEIPGNCQKTVRITAAPDLKVIETQIDLEINSRRVVRFHFMQRRVPGSAVAVKLGEPERTRQ